MARIYLSPGGTRISKAWDVPKALLSELLALPQGVIMVNFNTGGSAKEDRQVDLAILTPRALHVVELKNYRNPVVAPPNGHWFAIRKDGSRQPIVNRRGGEEESPPVQARRNAWALRRASSRYVNWPNLPVYTYVLLPYLHPDSRIETRTIEGVIVCKSIEDFLGAFVYNENRSSPRIPPHLLDALPEALGLTNKSHEFKPGGTLLYQIWQRRGAPPKASELSAAPKTPIRYTLAQQVRRLNAIPLWKWGIGALGLIMPPVVTNIAMLAALVQNRSPLPEAQSAFLLGVVIAPMIVGGWLGARHPWRLVAWPFRLVLLAGGLLMMVLGTAIKAQGWMLAGAVFFGLLAIALVRRFPSLRALFYGWALAVPWWIFTTS